MPGTFASSCVNNFKLVGVDLPSLLILSDGKTVVLLALVASYEASLCLAEVLCLSLMNLPSGCNSVSAIYIDVFD